MELWEFNACIRAYNYKHKDTSINQIAVAWQTAAFTGAAFAGKLKRLSRYVKDTSQDKATTAPSISKEEFDARLKALKERRAASGTQEP